MNPPITTPLTPSPGADRLEKPPRLDTLTIRRLKALGLLSGWRCATVGAPTASIAGWLADRVGRTGRVVAVDTDARVLESRRRDGLEVRAHDMASRSLEAEYDLVLTRLSAIYLAGRERLLRNMTASLRPGGWLLVEECDLGPASGFPRPTSSLQEIVNDAVRRVLDANNAQARDGMPLTALLRELGLQHIQSQPRTLLLALNLPASDALVFQLEALRDRLVEARLLTHEQCDRAIEEARNAGDNVPEAAGLASCWGRKPVMGV